MANQQPKPNPSFMDEYERKYPPLSQEQRDRLLPQLAEDLRQERVRRLQAQQPQRIINEYGAIMESSSQEYGAVSPEALLPYAREQIKEALKLLARAYRNEPDTLEFFATGFVWLGSFVPDEEAEAWKEFNNHISPETDLARGKLMLQAMDRMQEQSAELQTEWKEFLSELKSGEPK